MGIATRDIGKAGIAAFALLAGALLLFPADAAASQCSRENRVDHRNAECLSASWKSGGIFKKGWFRVQNMCAAYGQVTAKVDLVAARDMTVRLNNGIPRRGSVWRRIRSISCCSDAGDLCNRSDMVTDEGCLARFKRVSTAPLSCRDMSASAAISGENYSCTVTARCRRSSHPMDTFYDSTEITVPFLALGNVHNCGGALSPGPCNDDPSDTARVSVLDATAFEFWHPSLDFRVFLSRMLRETVRIDYATSDGTATAGSDYRATSGTLTFGPGETAKTISVPVLDDSHHEGAETLTLTLSNPRPLARVRLADATAIGVIANADPVPKAWIGRFGRSVADQVLDAVDDRMQAEPAPGVQARLAGQRIGASLHFAAGPDGDLASEEAPASGLGQWSSERALLPGSSFSLTAETGRYGFVSVWGRGAVTRLAGGDAAGAEAEGNVAVNGEVTSGLLGVDWTRGSWTTGLIVSRSRGDGGYRGTGVGAMASTLMGVWPWTRYAVGERFSVWGMAGYGDGSLTLEPRAEDGAHAGTIRTDLDLWMAAAGLRGIAVDGGDDGVSLAVKTDAMTVQTASDAVSGAGGNLAAAEAELKQLRLGLEASRPFPLGDGSVLTPRMEIGLRHDGGDAEIGFGAEIGAGLTWTEPRRGLSAELRGRGLLTHEADDFQDRRLSGSFAWDPVAGDRGPRLSLTHRLGVPAHGGEAPLGRTTLAGLASNDNGQDVHQRRLEARFGYGFPASGDRLTATPEIAVGLSDAGRDYSLGWRLARDGDALDGTSLELALEVRRLESVSWLNEPPEHAAVFRVTSRF